MDIDSIKSDNHLYSSLIDLKIIGDNELEIQKIINNRFNLNPTINEMDVLLHPTLNCNLACPYCFQKYYTKNTLDSDSINALSEFLFQQALTTQTKVINLTWTGGEPLLAVDNIKQINRELQGKLPNVLLKMIIITNGTLLSDFKLNELAKIGINTIQITIDGNKKQHNDKRSINNIDTFSIIIKTIDNILLNHPAFHLIIRVNIDKRNINGYSTLVSTLSQKYSGKNYSVFPEFVKNYNDHNSEVVLNKVERANFILKLLKNKLFDIEILLSHSDHGCVKVRDNSFAIAPDLKFYLCETTVGEDKYSKSITEILQISKFRDIPLKCTQCSLIPLCNWSCEYNNDCDTDSNCHIMKGMEAQFLSFL